MTQVLEQEVAEAEVALTRSCSRCDGQQHLAHSDAKRGFGVYRCDTCQMRVGYDLDATPAEFLLYRGVPAYWNTSEVSGIRLLEKELRIATRDS